MNRQQRRSNEKANKNEFKMTIKAEEMAKIRKQAIKIATEQAMVMTLALPLMALRDEFGFGKQRLEKFSSKMYDLIDSYERGYITLQDLHECLREEVGMELRND